MTDPIDDIIRKASAPGRKTQRTAPRNRLALAVLLGLAGMLLGLPVLLAMTGHMEDALLGFAIGDANWLTGGDH